MKKKINYDICRFSDYVVYDESSKTSLRWKVSPSNSVKINSEAGVLPIGVRSGTKISGNVRIEGISYSIHRVIWNIFNGSIKEGNVVDHIDGNPWNNCIANLREVTVGENQRNQKMFRTNTSGTQGVGRYSSKRCDDYFMAWFSNGTGRMKQKAFSVNKYGEDQAKQLAINWRKDNLKELEQQGIFYSERHGTKNEDIITVLNQ